jgi:hypothetical protein
MFSFFYFISKVFFHLLGFGLEFLVTLFNHLIFLFLFNYLNSQQLNSFLIYLNITEFNQLL